MDPNSFAPLPASRPAALMAGKGTVDGRPVWVLATDPSIARGAIGVSEAQIICMLMQTARAEPHPIVWILDSAGAKVSEGIQALGAFRELYREAVLTRLAGVPMIALLGRACFGGASLLAALAERRIYSEHTLLAVSGPGVIQALSGKDQLDARDPGQVRELMSGPVRAQLDAREVLMEDNPRAFLDAARQWLAGPRPLDLQACHRQLGERLREIGPDAATDMGSARSRLQRLAPPGYAIDNRGGVVTGIAAGKPLFAGVLTGEPVGAEVCWLLADELLALCAGRPSVPVILLLDAAGHAATARDEKVMLSSYLAHLSLVAASLAQAGHRVVLWIPGTASGASYVAFAAPAEHVSALPSACIRILPRDAVREILGDIEEQEIAPQELIGAHVIDSLLGEHVGRS